MRFRILAMFLSLLFISMPLWAAEKIKPAQAAVAEKGKGAPPATPANETVGASENYIIGPGDLLDISVWQDESLSRATIVLPDGRISFPLVGEVMAAGRTLGDLKKEMEGRLTRYVPNIILSLDVKQVNSVLIYVLGRVNSPGRFALNTNVDVLQALATAGGFNPFAKRSKIRIFRHEGGKTAIFKFDYDDVTGSEHLEQNIMLKRGDVIVVP
jgi:polysaccharide export outer membrane protein